MAIRVLEKPLGCLILCLGTASTERSSHERSLFSKQIPDLHWATKANGAFPWDCPAFEAFRGRGDARRKQRVLKALGCSVVMLPLPVQVVDCLLLFGDSAFLRQGLFSRRFV